MENVRINYLSFNQHSFGNLCELKMGANMYRVHEHKFYQLAFYPTHTHTLSRFRLGAGPSRAHAHTNLYGLEVVTKV